MYFPATKSKLIFKKTLKNLCRYTHVVYGVIGQSEYNSCSDALLPVSDKESRDLEFGGLLVDTS